ncbi:hypothetical protein V6x_43170 [Gimesia chilikensis]|uniref:Uncharacterized protein n=1 Tax=Gimesia chilikensis TaxID=2605989 RepID=A0A517WH49_9PLAN|nr:hypothetical protein V6x_43170 [Gimesia chilikensis]
MQQRFVDIEDQQNCLCVIHLVDFMKKPNRCSEAVSMSMRKRRPVVKGLLNHATRAGVWFSLVPAGHSAPRGDIHANSYWFDLTKL